MTDKERLEEIKTWLNRGFDLTEEDIEWLIEQAELVGYFARKNGELNEFLNKYIEPKHLGKNVIDVAMDIIVKQAERVQELEELIEDYKTVNKELHDRRKKLRKQNKRYREHFNWIIQNSTDKYAVQASYEALEGEG